MSSDIKRARKTAQDASRALENIQHAIEQGVYTSSTQQRIEELTAQRDRALAFAANSADFDMTAEDLADFLQYGTTLSDADMIDALVYQIVVADEEIIVALNYDVEPNVPQRFTVDGFAKECEWAGKNNEHPDDRVFVQNSNGSPFTHLYETRTGYSVIVHSGKLAFVIRRAA